MRSSLRGLADHGDPGKSWEGGTHEGWWWLSRPRWEEGSAQSSPSVLTLSFSTAPRRGSQGSAVRDDQNWVPTSNIAQSYDLDHWLCCLPQPLKFHFTTNHPEPSIILSPLEKKIAKMNDETILLCLPSWAFLIVCRLPSICLHIFTWLPPGCSYPCVFSYFPLDVS